MNDKKNDINTVLQNAYPFLDTILPEFEFKGVRGHWVSGNTLKVDGSGEGDSIGRVYIYENACFCLKDWRNKAVEIPTYLINSPFHEKIKNYAEALSFIKENTGAEGQGRRFNADPVVKKPSFSQEELLAQQEKRLKNIEPAIVSYFSENKDFRGLSEKAFRYFGFGTTICVQGATPETILNIPLSLPLYTTYMDILSWVTYNHGRADKYLYPAGISKPLIQFRRPRMRPKNEVYSLASDEIILTEGVFDCLTAWFHGIYCVAAVGGSSISAYQSTLLTNAGIKKAVVIFDTDKAGRDGAVRVVEELRRHKIKGSILELPSFCGDKKVDLDLYLREKGTSAFIKLLRDGLPQASSKETTTNFIGTLFPAISKQDFKNTQNVDCRTIRTNLPFHSKKLGYNIGTLTTVVGKTGHGKTTFLINQTIEALLGGSSVAFLSFEESYEVLFGKIFVCLLGFSLRNKLPSNHRLARFKDEIRTVMTEINESNGCPDMYFEMEGDTYGYLTYILRTPSHRHHKMVELLWDLYYETYIETGLLWVYYDPHRLRENVFGKVDEHCKSKRGFDLMVIDYIQLMECDERTTRQNDLRETCILLREHARENNYAILAAAQFNREIKDFSDIHLNKIGECSEIERSSHLVLSLWNAAHENMCYKSEYPQGMSNIASVMLRVLKSRDGVLERGYYSHDAKYNVLQKTLPEENIVDENGDSF